MAEATAWKAGDDELFEQDGLFAMAPTLDAIRNTLASRYGVPPVSVLDRRGGEWQERRRRWLSLGIRSEVGRGTKLVANRDGADSGTNIYNGINEGTSVFDPVLCELSYRWFSAPGDSVLDPFAGGSVRGVVASVLGRGYVGIELRPEQVAANREQAALGSEAMPPLWIEGDSARVTAGLLLEEGGDADMVFSCPPYADLEVYSQDPADLSNMPYDEFLEAYRTIIANTGRLLAEDRFAVWVVGDVRDKRGRYRGLVADTIKAFQDAGLHLHNEAILIDPMGTAPVRAPRYFNATRKLVRVHQHCLVFCKGDPRRATERLGAAADE